VLPYVRTSDGLVTAMHGIVPLTSGRHRVAIFNPASNDKQVSRLHIINPSGLEDVLGDGQGKRRLDLDSPTPITVVNLLASPTGHLTNLSAARAP